MKRKYSVIVLAFIFISTGTFFQNCARPAPDEMSSTDPTGSATTRDTTGSNTSSGVMISGFGNTISQGGTSSTSSGSTPSTSTPFSTTPSSTTTTTTQPKATVAADDAKVIPPVVGTNLDVTITIATAHINLAGAVFVAAFYNNAWFFWDPSKASSNRWTQVDLNSATYPEFVAGKAPPEFDIRITDILTSAHGAKIHVGMGYGSTPQARRNDLVNSQRYKHVYTVP